MLYLMQSGKYLKIGFTENLTQRMYSYTTQNPDFQLLDVCEGNQEDEKFLHNSLKEYQHRGEWFHYSDRIIQKFIKFKSRKNKDLIYTPSELLPDIYEDELTIIFTKRGIDKLSNLVGKDLEILMALLKGISNNNILQCDFDSQVKIMSSLKKPISSFYKYVQKLVHKDLIIKDGEMYRFNPNYIQVQIVQENLD